MTGKIFLIQTDRVHEDDLKVKDWTNISFERMVFHLGLHV